MSKGGGSFLPSAGDGIGVEGGVFSDDAYASLDGLGDEESVERVAVMELQGFHSAAVRGFEVDSNNAKALEFAREEDVPIVLDFEVEAFGGTFDGDLPETCRGVVNGQVVIDDAARGCFESPVAVEHPKERVGVEQPATDGGGFHRRGIPKSSARAEFSAGLSNPAPILNFRPASVPMREPPLRVRGMILATAFLWREMTTSVPASTASRKRERLALTS